MLELTIACTSRIIVVVVVVVVVDGNILLELTLGKWVFLFNHQEYIYNNAVVTNSLGCFSQ
jgi:hypothetical protein